MVGGGAIGSKSEAVKEAGRREPAPIAALGFGWLADEVGEGETEPFDGRSLAGAA